MPSKTEQVEHEARQRADRMVESLAGNVSKLVDVLSLLDEKLTSQRLQGTPFEALANARTSIIPGIPATRIAIVFIFLSNGGVAVNFNFQQGSGNNFGPLSGRGGAGNVFIGGTQGSLVLPGGIEAPVMIADVANDIAINNTSAQPIVGHAVWTTIEP